MHYDTLIHKLNKLTKDTEDDQLRSSLLDLSWEVSKGGISGLWDSPSVEQDGMIDFVDMMKRISKYADKTGDKKSKDELNSLYKNLARNGIDGNIPSREQQYSLEISERNCSKRM